MGTSIQEMRQDQVHTGTLLKHMDDRMTQSEHRCFEFSEALKLMNAACGGTPSTAALSVGVSPASSDQILPIPPSQPDGALAHPHTPATHERGTWSD